MRLIIDTDTAGDDTYSLLLAMRTPGSTLEAVTICVGNVPFDQQVENALATIEVAGFSGKVPVYLGARRPMVKPWEASTMHGNDGMSGANLPIARQRPETMHAVDAIIERVMAEPGEIDILAQAPLTNIALAVMKEPRIAKAVRHLWIMGGTDNADEIGDDRNAATSQVFPDHAAFSVPSVRNSSSSSIAFWRSKSCASIATPVARGNARPRSSNSNFSSSIQMPMPGRRSLPPWTAPSGRPPQDALVLVRRTPLDGLPSRPTMTTS
ncbi:nucleoside hydrolase [Neorhizobium galegae]|uniref:nucleoside hydrolase n=1 Tax=Neorhizobium galegae TaxID=399 RepID=UPI0021070C86|nr:nucleoside hydrolase [Neorhizobium galegae]MCQ1769739.1 nucleoside hydrolase [Neorhizobium galegae]